RGQVRVLVIYEPAYGADNLGASLGQAVREEQLQRAHVAKLVRRLVVGCQAVLEHPFARLGQVVHGAGAPAERLRSTVDEALVFEALELGVDLAVARGPEVAGGPIYERLDLVAGALTKRDHPEDHAARR